MALRPQCTKFGMSYTKETVYGTAVANAAIDKLFVPNEPSLIDYTKEKIDDSAFIKGHEFPENTALDIVIAENITVPFNFPSSLELLGMLLSFALGNAAVAGAAGDFTHTFKTTNLCSSDQLPSTSWILGILGDTASYLKVKGVVINELKITLDKTGWIGVTGSAITDGSFSVEVAYSFPANAAVDYILGNQVDFLIGPSGGALVSNKSLFRGMEFTISNNLAVEDGRGNVGDSSIHLKDLRTETRVIGLTLKLQGHQGDAFWLDFDNEVLKDIQITVTKSATRLLDIRIKNCRLSSVGLGFETMRDVIDVSVKPFYTVADASPVIVTVKNGVTAYLL